MAYSNYGYGPGGQIQQSLPRQVEYKGLKDYISIEFIDTDPTSDNFFNVLEFPTKLTSGKNLFKLRANANTLAKDSQIHFEVLDYNGDAIYYEPLDYFEPDGTRVVTIWIDENTVPGLARVYIAGRTAIDPDTGQAVPFSKDYNSPNYLNIPNVLWSRTVSIQPESPNKTEIIFNPDLPPKILLSEKIFPLFGPAEIITNTEQQYDGTYALITGSDDTKIRIEPNMNSDIPVPTFGEQNQNGIPYQYTYVEKDVINGNTTNTHTTYGVQGIKSNKIISDKAFFQADMLGGVLRIEQPLMQVQPWTFAISGSVVQDGEKIDSALAVPHTQIGNQLVGAINENTVGVSWSYWGFSGDAQALITDTYNNIYGSEFYANYFYTGEGPGPYTGQFGSPPAINNYNSAGNISNQMHASGSYMFTIKIILSTNSQMGKITQLKQILFLLALIAHLQLLAH